MNYVPVGTQIDVITSPAPVTVVLGGAGTGKTTTAAAAAAAELEVRDVARQKQRHMMINAGNFGRLMPRTRVLFLSFSRTAVAQVIDRASGVVGPLLERIEVSTFHGFAWRVVNDFGASYGYPPPLRILSVAEGKVPGAPPGMTYADLMPAACNILRHLTVTKYYDRRYGLVICDEFQDTNDDEWRFLQRIAPSARRILLGDVNQCIYAELKRIDPIDRVNQAVALPGAVQIDLPRASHRDPSGVLPAAADAARERRFDDEAIAVAARTSRLRISRAPDDHAHEVIVELIQAERAVNHTVSVFTHSNVATAALSDDLEAAGIRHEQVGLSEAYGEALNAQLAMMRYAVEGTPGRRALAVYVAANTRVDAPLVEQIMRRSNPSFERTLQRVVADLDGAARPVLDVDRLADVIAGAYERVGTHRGQLTWIEAARRTRAAMWVLLSGGSIETVQEEVGRARHAALVGDVGLRQRPVQVMNLHQTKGREADATILLLQADEYHGSERHPYPKLSRLLYVVLTRARHVAHIVVPETVHPLWEPLVAACETATSPASVPD